MKFYLSSYKLGNNVQKLRKIIPKNKKTAYVPNALDYSDDLERRKASEAFDVNELSGVGLDVEVLDLRKYFGKKEKLRKKMNEFGVFWVRGGNTFVLRQAMRLSGFDDVIKSFVNKDVLYGGYSAGVCVLAPSLKGLELVDDPLANAYGKNSKVIWEGLGLIDYAIAPHFKSNHPESALVDKEVAYFIKNKVLFKAIKDGEVIIIQ